MIENSESYKKLKAQIQDSIDFVLLSCHAVPALKGYMKAVDKGGAAKIPDPDIFACPADHSRLMEIAPRYRKMLGRFLILSSFSFFEAYITDVFTEIFDFQGEQDKFLERATLKRSQTISAADANVEAMIKKLREKPKKGKQKKYTAAHEILSAKGYRFPTDLFATYGILRLQEQLKDLRAVQIPDIVQGALGLTMAQSDVEDFHRIRELRNNVAHGKVTEVDLSRAIDDNRLLRSLAVKIDAHVVKHFFVLEI